MRGVRAVLAVALLCGASTTGHAHAAVQDVPCSADALQAAVADAAGTPEADVLRLAAACVYPVSATLTIPQSGGPLTIRGRSGTVLDGGSGRRLVRVEDGASATLERLVLRNGLGPFDGNQNSGGAVRSTGTLRVADSAFLGNDGGRVGGAIDSTVGSLTVVRSLFSGNRSDNGGAIYAEGTLTVVSSTFTDNTSPRGSAILSFATATVSSTTIVGNHGQALHQDTRQLSVVNTALAGNPRNCALTGGASLVDLGGNVEDQVGTCGWSASTSFAALDPRLLPLADNGGPTRTYVPGPGSPLLDRGARCSSAGPAVFDQRRVRRPSSGCDIGAVESTAAGTLTGETTFGTVDDGDVSRRAYLLRSSGADPLVVGSAAVTGAGYTVFDDGCSGRTLPNGASCSVVVELRPARAGPAAGRLDILDSGDAAPRTLQLVGSGRGASLPAAAPSVPASSRPPAVPAAGPGGSGPTTPTDARPGGPSGAEATTPVAPPAPVVAAPQRLVFADGEAQLVSTRRATFPQALPLPTQVSLDMEDLARSAWLAALLLALLALPVGVVNETLDTHRVELAERFTALRRRLRRFQRLAVARGLSVDLPLRVAAPAAALVSAVFYGFLDPGFGWDRESAASVLGLLVTVVVTGLLGRQTKLVFLRRTYGVAATLRLLPGFVGLALVCTVLSRITGLQPGLVLGSVLGVQLSRGLRWREEGQSVAVSSAALAVAALAAWFAWVPVARAAAGDAPSFAVLVLDVALAATFVIGVEALAFGLVPLSYLDGRALWRWSKRSWLGLSGLGMFGFVHVVLHPTEGAVDFIGRERYLAGLLVAYLVCGAAVWAYFRFRFDPASDAT